MKKTTAHYGHNGWAMPVTYRKKYTWVTVANCVTAAGISVLAVILASATFAYAVQVWL